MTERSGSFPRVSGLRRGPVEPLSPQAWLRVETAVFSRLDSALVPWSLVPAPLHSHAAPRIERPLRVHWAASVGLALAAATAAAAVSHLVKHTASPPALEVGLPAELAHPDGESTPAATEAVGLEAAPRGPRATAAPARHATVSSSSTRAPSLHVSAYPAPPRPSAPAPVRPSVRRDLGSDRERLFERAASLESANAALALALYLSLASGDDAWAANALYAAARLEIDRGLREAGGQHLEEYLDRFPAGENIVDVSGLRQRADMEAR